MQIAVATSKKKEILDITQQIEEVISKQEKQNGSCLIFVQHTTCCITTADLDPGTDLDFLDFLQAVIPDLNFRHPHDPKHAPDHILSSIIGPSIITPFDNKQLQLGTWQRIILVELDGPRTRNLVVKVI